MADINRKTVDFLVLHHAVSPTWENKSREEIINWFSDSGFSRGYGSNPENWSGLYKPNGERSYSQAQLAGQRVDSSTPDATDDERKKGYRLIELVQDIWGQICWHAGNWDINTRSIGIENLGDYREISLRDNDCNVIADFWRSQDRALGGATQIVGHKEVSDTSTACPCNIMNSRQRILDLVNSNDSGWVFEAPVVDTPVVTVPVTLPEVPESNIELGSENVEVTVSVPETPNVNQKPEVNLSFIAKLIEFITKLIKKVFNK